MQVHIKPVSRRETANNAPEESMETPTTNSGKRGQPEAAIASIRSIVVVSREQISCDLLGEAVILDLNKGVYYGLDEVGARMWALMQEPRCVSDIRDAIVNEYDVDPDRCEQDVLDLLRELMTRNLIEIRHETIA